MGKSATIMLILGKRSILDMKTGLVVEGGGMKCAYSAGILDRFLDEGFWIIYQISMHSRIIASAYLPDLQMWQAILPDSADETFDFM